MNNNTFTFNNEKGSKIYNQGQMIGPKDEINLYKFKNFKGNGLIIGTDGYGKTNLIINYLHELSKTMKTTDCKVIAFCTESTSQTYADLFKFHKFYSSVLCYVMPDQSTSETKNFLEKIMKKDSDGKTIIVFEYANPKLFKEEIIKSILINSRTNLIVHTNFPCFNNPSIRNCFNNVFLGFTNNKRDKCQIERQFCGPLCYREFSEVYSNVVKHYRWLVVDQTNSKIWDPEKWFFHYKPKHTSKLYDKMIIKKV
jgi:hypothetical protein